MKRVLAVICTFNPHDRSYNSSFEDFSHQWFKTINSWRMQRKENLHVDIVVADNVSGQKTRNCLIKFQNKVKDFYIDFIDQWFTSPFICFNHVLTLFKNKNYDYFAYSASDVSFYKENDLEILLNEMESDERCCLISPQADNDMAQRFDFDERKSPTKIKLGQGVNAHIYIWSRKFMEAYDYKAIDIIGGPRSEGFYPFLCAAIKCHMLLSHRVCIHHIGKHDRYYVQPLLSPQYKRDFFGMLKKGTKIGLGFEECLRDISMYKNMFLNKPSLKRFFYLVAKYIVLNQICANIIHIPYRFYPKKIKNIIDKLEGKPYYHKHNEECFDEKGYAKSDKLYKFIKDNLFLKEYELNYKKIPFNLVVPEK